MYRLKGLVATLALLAVSHCALAAETPKPVNPKSGKSVSTSSMAKHIKTAMSPSPAKPAIIYPEFKPFMQATAADAKQAVSKKTIAAAQQRPVTNPAPNVQIAHPAAKPAAHALAAAKKPPVYADDPAPVSVQEVLPDGAQVVAGDPDKNEFFIVGKGQRVPEVKSERIARIEKIPVITPDKPQLPDTDDGHQLPLADLTPHPDKNSKLALNEVPKPNVIVVHNEYKENMRPHLETKPFVAEEEPVLAPPQRFAAAMVAELSKPLQKTKAATPDLQRVIHQTVHQGDSQEYVAQMLKGALKPGTKVASNHRIRGIVTSAESNTLSKPVTSSAVTENTTPTLARADTVKRSLPAEAFQMASSAPAKRELPPTVLNVASDSSEEQGLLEPQTASKSVEHIVDTSTTKATQAKPIKMADARKVSEPIAPTKVAQSKATQIADAQRVSKAITAAVKQSAAPLPVKHDKNPTSYANKAKVAAHPKIAKQMKVQAKLAKHIQVISIAEAEQVKRTKPKAHLLTAQKKLDGHKILAAKPKTHQDKKQVVLTDSDYEVVYKNKAFTVKQIKAKG